MSTGFGILLEDSTEDESKTIKDWYSFHILCF